MAVWPGGALASTFRLLAVLIIALAECGCWEGTSREVLATVLSLEGPASISVNDGRTFSEFRPAQNPGSHAVLRTSPGSQLSLALLPNCLVHLEENTCLAIVRLALTKDGNETGDDMQARLAEARLINGRIFVSHVWGETRARLAVSTANGEVSTPSNAAFWIECADGNTRVTCASGWVEFHPSGAAKSTRVPPGSIGQWPSASGNITAADGDPRGQDALEQAAELEQKLRDLAVRKRNVLPR
ncbi:MAG: FecR domain-containing protein [Chthoniobacterales bacterium]